jgi:hypothetical protein
MPYRGPAAWCGGERSRQVWWAYGIRRSALGVVAAWLMLSPRDAAFAACDPAAGSNVTATCTGTTVNQNGTFGYGTVAATNLNVTVVPGASVTGTTRGINFNTGSVANSGTISGGSFGVAGSTANVSNSGTISGGGTPAASSPPPPT